MSSVARFAAVCPCGTGVWHRFVEVELAPLVDILLCGGVPGWFWYGELPLVESCRLLRSECAVIHRPEERDKPRPASLHLSHSVEQCARLNRVRYRTLVHLAFPFGH